MPRVFLSLIALTIAPATASADLGVMADVGVPSGAGGALVYRPASALRLHAGVAHNGVGPGAQAGATVAPLGGWVTPTLSLDAGRFVPRDANPAVESLFGAPMASAPEELGYDFASAHLGLELGRERLTFYLHAGVSYLRGRARGVDVVDDGSVSTATDVALEAVGVSARAGLILYLTR